MTETERYWKNLPKSEIIYVGDPPWKRVPGVPRFLHWIGRCEGVGKVNGGECSYCLKAAMRAIGEEWKA